MFLVLLFNILYIFLLCILIAMLFTYFLLYIFTDYVKPFQGLELRLLFLVCVPTLIQLDHGALMI